MFVHLISSLWFICMLPVSAEWYYAYLTISPHIEYMMLMYTSSAVITLFIVYLLFALVCWAVLILSFCNLKKRNKKNTYFPDHRLLYHLSCSNDRARYILWHIQSIVQGCHVIDFYCCSRATRFSTALYSIPHVHLRFLYRYILCILSTSLYNDSLFALFDRYDMSVVPSCMR